MAACSSAHGCDRGRRTWGLGVHAGVRLRALHRVCILPVVALPRWGWVRACTAVHLREPAEVQRTRDAQGM